MRRSEDITGQKFGRLTAVKVHHQEKDYRYCWLFKCDCGGEIVARKSDVMGGRVRFCKKCKYESQTKHGQKNTRLYAVWNSMKQRCLNKNHKSYQAYGGRGITICKEWQDNFINFYNWALANGYNEQAEFMQCTIDRIDVNGNYEPSNCRWVNARVQGDNTRTANRIEYNGEIHCLSEWARILNIGRKTIYYKLKKGLSFEEIVNKSKNKKGG